MGCSFRHWRSRGDSKVLSARYQGGIVVWIPILSGSENTGESNAVLFRINRQKCLVSRATKRWGLLAEKIGATN